MTRNNGLIFSIIAALGAANLAIGMMVQVIPLALDAAGANKFVIGTNAMFGQASVLLVGLSLVWLRQHFKSHNLVMAALATGLACFIAFAFMAPLYAWFPIRFLAGIMIATVFTTGESWLQANSDDKVRGRVMGSYMTSQTLTFALGPFFIKYIGFQGPLPWLLSAAAIVLSFSIMWFLKVPETAHGETRAKLLTIGRKGFFAFLCFGVTTFFEAFSLTFFALYAIQNGFDAGTATQLLSFGIAACVFFFFGIGYLADHWSRNGMIAICAAGAIVFSLLQIPAIITFWIWPLIVLLRASAFGTYLGGFSILGDRFKGTEMVAAASINSMLWGISGVIGPPLAGLALDAYGLWLLPWFMAVCYVPVVVGLAFTSNAQSKTSQPEGSSA